MNNVPMKTFPDSPESSAVADQAVEMMNRMFTDMGVLAIALHINGRIEVNTDDKADPVAVHVIMDAVFDVLEGIENNGR